MVVRCLTGIILCLALWTGPSAHAQCASPCAASCSSTGVTSGFAAALTTLYNDPDFKTLIADPTVDPDTSDLDGNGIIDLAQVMLVDAVLADDQAPNHCCVLAAYQTNLALASALADQIESTDEFGLPLFPQSRLVMQLLGKDTLIKAITSITTMGEQSAIDFFVGSLTSIPDFPPVEPNDYDTSNAQYLSSIGDADLDDVCNVGEFAAVIAGAGTFGDFVAAALNPAMTNNGGGCPLCSTATVWFDINHSGSVFGTELEPFNSLFEALGIVDSAGTILFLSGSRSVSTPIIVTQPVTFRSSEDPPPSSRTHERSGFISSTPR